MVISLLMWFLFGATIAYLLVIGIITYGWFRLSASVKENDIVAETKVSIVIAVRNESKSIKQLLLQLVKQSYTSDNYEIIIIDDHSTDNTNQQVSQFIDDNHGLKTRLINASGNGKKSALKEGISQATGELVITTDGDCRVKQDWLKSIVNYYNSSHKKLIIGPVVYENEETILQKFFSLDFVSLVASGGGSVGARLPLMGNGANLAFSRDVYADIEEVSGKYHSGDDVFLIHAVTKKYGSGAIGFLRSNDAIVSTSAPANFSAFIKQRKRWASKAVGYRMVWPVMVSLVVLLYNMFLFALLCGSLFYLWLLPIYFLIIVTKFLIDAPLVYSFLAFSQKTKLKPLFFLQEFVYPVYIIIAATASLFFRYSWKGREGLR